MTYFKNIRSLNTFLTENHELINHDWNEFSTLTCNHKQGLFG